MNSKINVGVVGCGYWGPNLIRNFRAIDECRMVAMCDRDPQRLQHLHSLYPEVALCSDYEAFLARPDIDAIAIATPVRLHHRMAKAALEAGKHVLLEKPMASSVAECEELNALAAKRGLVLMVGHTFLYSAAVRKIKEIVDHHDIGDLRYISARRLNLGLFQTDINVTWDLAPHDLSIILYIMQEAPHSVNCRGASLIHSGTEDITSLSLHFAHERSALIHSSWHDPRKIREMTIVGSKRMIVYDDIPAQEKVKIYDVRVECPPHYDTFAEFHYAYHYGDTYSPYVKQDEPLRNECRHFLECIATGATPLTSGAAGLEVVRILEASSVSSRQNGSPVDLRDFRGSSATSSAAPSRPTTPKAAAARPAVREPRPALAARALR